MTSADSYDDTNEIEDRELFTALLAVFGLGVVIAKRKSIARIPEGRWLLAAYVVLSLGCVFTVIESLFLPDLFNFLEHICYLACTAMVGLFCWRVTRNEEVVAR